MHRNISLIAVVVLIAAGATMAACGGGDKTEPTATAAATSSTPSSNATGVAPTPIPMETAVSESSFGCPSQWTKYTCPTVSENKGALTAPFRAGTDAEMICANVGFYTSGVINDNSILFKVPSGTELVAPVNGTIVSVRSMPAPHDYTKSVAISGMPFLIYVYFVGDIKVEADANVSRGDVIGVSTGNFPTDTQPDSKLMGASVLVNFLGFDSKMLDATSADLWVGNTPTCYSP